MKNTEEEKSIPSEGLRPAPASEPASPSGSLPTPEMIDAVGETQEGLLKAVARYVPRETFELLRAKAALEMRLLRESLERGVRSAAARAQTVEILHRGFFKLQKLDPHSFE